MSVSGGLFCCRDVVPVSLVFYEGRDSLDRLSESLASAVYNLARYSDSAQLGLQTLETRSQRLFVRGREGLPLYSPTCADTARFCWQLSVISQTVPRIVNSPAPCEYHVEVCFCMPTCQFGFAYGAGSPWYPEFSGTSIWKKRRGSVEPDHTLMGTPAFLLPIRGCDLSRVLLARRANCELPAMVRVIPRPYIL